MEDRQFLPWSDNLRNVVITFIPNSSSCAFLLLDHGSSKTKFLADIATEHCPGSAVEKAQTNGRNDAIGLHEEKTKANGRVRADFDGTMHQSQR
mmetsp:Transcript_20489/g.32963  ORF Transcript_20489/g.32963 Transcript_20489/m.32963 type:complete len:94 (-) Transcript_20489:393-674(-)